MRRLLAVLLIGMIGLSTQAFCQEAYGQMQQVAGKVVYATQNIAAGQPIGATALEERQMPAENIPPDAVRSVKDAVGHFATNEIPKGRMLSKNDLK